MDREQEGVKQDRVGVGEGQRQQEMGWTGEALQEGEIGHERER